MSTKKRIVKAGANGSFIGENGEKLTPPSGWAFLHAGDAAITRKVTAGGEFWRVQTQMGRRIISKGIWAPAAAIAQARQGVDALRATDGYKKKLMSDRKRRAQKQTDYEQEFYLAVRAFLAFNLRYQAMEMVMAEAVTKHTIPVGSGTVARTETIPIEERAAKAVVAWMRHRTTAYDSMKIARIKGERREVRQVLAQRSVELLHAYREGREPAPGCPLQKVLEKSFP